MDWTVLRLLDLKLLLQKVLLFYVNNLSWKDNFWYKYCTIPKKTLQKEEYKIPWNDSVFLFHLFSNLKEEIAKIVISTRLRKAVWNHIFSLF